MTAELAVISLSQGESGGSNPGPYHNDNMDFLAELSAWYPFAKKATAICEFFREQERSKALSQDTALQRQNADTGDMKDNDVGSRGATVPGHHVQTFFQTSTQARSSQRWALRPSAQRDASLFDLGSPNFPLQSNPLEKIVPGPTQVRGGAEAMDDIRRALEAHGLMFLP